MSLVCYHCGHSLADLTMPLGRLETCRDCGRYLRVCLMCRFYDPRESTKQCREEEAEEVRDKAGSNFCEFFDARLNAFDAGDRDKAQQAQQQLRELFDDGTDSTTTPEESSDQKREVGDAEALFRK